MIYTLDEIARRIRPVAERYRLRAVYVFGSYARGEAGEGSDVDLLVDTDGANLKTLFALGGLYSDLEDALEKELSLVTLDSLEQPCRMESDIYFRENVTRERRKIYAVA